MSPTILYVLNAIGMAQWIWCGCWGCLIRCISVSLVHLGNWAASAIHDRNRGGRPFETSWPTTLFRLHVADDFVCAERLETGPVDVVRMCRNGVLHISSVMRFANQSKEG